MMIDAIEVEVNLMASGKIKDNYGKDINKTQDSPSLRPHKPRKKGLK
jgi:hypothetical protein